MAKGEVKTRGDQNEIRKTVKARQRAVAKAKALHSSESAGFSLRETQQERREREQEERKRQQRREYAQQRAKEEGEQLLANLEHKGSLVLDCSTFEGERSARNLVNAIYNAERQFQFGWNRDWQVAKRLQIAVKKKAPVAS